MLKGKSLFSIIVCAFIILSFAVSMNSFAADKPAAPAKKAPGKAAAAKAAPAKPMTLKGVIEAVKTKEGAQTGKIRIAAGEEKYQIAMNAKGKELALLIGKTVEINGSLKTSAKGKKTFTVTTFTIAE